MPTVLHQKIFTLDLISGSQFRPKKTDSTKFCVWNRPEINFCGQFVLQWMKNGAKHMEEWRQPNWSALLLWLTSQPELKRTRKRIASELRWRKTFPRFTVLKHNGVNETLITHIKLQIYLLFGKFWLVWQRYLVELCTWHRCSDALIRHCCLLWPGTSQTPSWPRKCWTGRKCQTRAPAKNCTQLGGWMHMIPTCIPQGFQVIWGACAVEGDKKRPKRCNRNKSPTGSNYQTYVSYFMVNINFKFRSFGSFSICMGQG